MRKSRRSTLACVAIIAGLVIIMSLILPVEFWWFIFAAILIAFGLWSLRC